ncbi:hypothetical protein B0H15DRAFT_1025574 [Mycena belliarum]|uniref:Uncharacterized protein n=1 Tax=Mycena belliarum TaxID=1033014 RepID=A0AAD6XLY8_9AGAR|nr:hypothetical protein B0H15DRAFT_1025574 [Mycena belliae]
MKFSISALFALAIAAPAYAAVIARTDGNATAPAKWLSIEEGVTYKNSTELVALPTVPTFTGTIAARVPASELRPQIKGSSHIDPAASARKMSPSPLAGFECGTGSSYRRPLATTRKLALLHTLGGRQSVGNPWCLPSRSLRRRRIGLTRVSPLRPAHARATSTHGLPGGQDSGVHPVRIIRGETCRAATGIARGRPRRGLAWVGGSVPSNGGSQKNCTGTCVQRGGLESASAGALAAPCGSTAAPGALIRAIRSFRGTRTASKSIADSARACPHIACNLGSAACAAFARSRSRRATRSRAKAALADGRVCAACVYDCRTQRIDSRGDRCESHTGPTRTAPDSPCADRGFGQRTPRRMQPRSAACAAFERSRSRQTDRACPRPVLRAPRARRRDSREPRIMAARVGELSRAGSTPRRGGRLRCPCVRAVRRGPASDTRPDDPERRRRGARGGGVASVPAPSAGSPTAYRPHWSTAALPARKRLASRSPPPHRLAHVSSCPSYAHASDGGVYSAFLLSDSPPPPPPDAHDWARSPHRITAALSAAPALRARSRAPSQSVCPLALAFHSRARRELALDTSSKSKCLKRKAMESRSTTLLSDVRLALPSD